MRQGAGQSWYYSAECQKSETQDWLPVAALQGSAVHFLPRGSYNQQVCKSYWRGR